MDLEKREPSGREKDKSSVEHLEELREKLYFAKNSSARRIAAFNLSWKQDDGFEILKEILLNGHSDRQSKTAAAYGLRSMRGRMKKIARQLLFDGLESKNKEITEVCKHSVKILEDREKVNTHSQKPKKKRRRDIKAFDKISHKSPRERVSGNKKNSSNYLRGGNRNFRRD